MSLAKEMTLAELEKAVDDKRAAIMASPYPYGPCECVHGSCPCSRHTGPAAFEVVRDGVTMKVCTKCDLTSDKPTQRLLLTADDAARVMEVFEVWDGLGAFCIRNMLKTATLPNSKAQSDE